MAVMLSEDQFNAMMARIATAGGGGGGHHSRKKLETKYMKLNDFDGDPANWSDWVFAFKRTVRSADKETYDLMEKVERATSDFDEAALNSFVESGDVSGVSGELYDVLCTVMKGDALTMLKSVEDCEGFKAWHKIWTKYNPKTMARALRLMGEITSPGAVKHTHEVDAAVQKWVLKVRMLEKQFDENIGNKMKIAIATGMMPMNIQDHIFQVVTGDTIFENLLEKIGSWVSSRVAMEGIPWTSAKSGATRTRTTRTRTWVP